MAKKSGEPKPNDRSVYMYTTPPKNAAPEVKKQHAQCIYCRMLVPKDALPAEGKHKKNCDLCVVIGSQDAVDGAPNRGSCGEMANWPTPDGMPDPSVIKEHAAKLATGAPGSATKEEVGYVERKVRCENCYFGGNPKCGWYIELSEKIPEFFKDAGDIEPLACCNTQTAPGTIAMDEAWRGSARLITKQDDGFAFDKKSVRRTDADGRLHIDVAHISKANVCEYAGREIPDWQQLGLDPDKLYKLYRDPDELAKGTATFNNIPILSRHVPVDVNDHRPDLVIGSTGTDASFDGTYLDNSLVFWSGEAIGDIESEYKKELSAAYRYRCDMTPGITPDGEAFDGVMRDIIGNHQALVREGRTGPDIVVGDSAIPNIKETFEMSKVLTRMGSVALGAVMISLKPKLAQDAKLDLGPIFAKLTSKNFKTKKPTIIAGLKSATAGKLAQDATLDDVVKIVDALEGTEVAEGADTDPDTGEIDEEEAMDAEGGELGKFLKGKLGEDDYKKAMDMMKPGAQDAEADEEKKKREAEEGKKLAGDVEAAVKEKTKDMVTKGAMDEALKKERENTQKQARDAHEAREAVRPYVGAVSMALDSAAGVYQAALTILGVENAEKIDPSAYPALLKAQKRPDQQHEHKPSIALDSAVEKSLAERFPHAAKIKVSA